MRGRRPTPLDPTAMRRDFLKLCSLAGLGVATPLAPRRARAEGAGPEPYGGPYFVVFNAAGGWDTTYLMDPKGTDGINRLYREGDIQTAGALRFAPNAAQLDGAAGGLSNEEFFKRYAAELLVFNGLDYSVNNHAPCSRYMATGKLDSLAYPTFAALAAACRGPDCPLAFLTFGNYSNTGNVVPMARVPYLPTLSRIANAGCVEGNPRSPYHEDFAEARIEAALRAGSEARAAAPQLPRAARAGSVLYAAQANSRALARVAPFVAGEVPKGRLPAQAEIALASFKAGVCVSANLSIGQFDSHANNDRDQMKLIPELLAGVDYTLRRAEELGIRDKLVVVVQSEMGRTPTYNKGDGKDHWSVGSIFFLGPGIAGGRCLGGTDAGQMLRTVRPDTLELADGDGGVRVRPEHIHLALRELAGIAGHPLAERFPLEVPAGERLGALWG